MRTLRVKKELCTGCNLCEMACSLDHTGIVNPAQARLKVIFTDDDLCYPIVCLHCQDPACVGACAAEAMYKDSRTGAVVVDEGKCTACLACVAACPFGAIFTGPEGEILKCDLCGGNPQCVKYCYPRPENNFPHLPSTEEACLQYGEIFPAAMAEEKP